jgi:hypothetical protein
LRRKKFIGALLILTALLSFCAWAKGLSVKPSTYFWRKVAVGKKVKMPIPLEIHNQSNSQRDYEVKVSLNNLPNVNFITFSENQFAISPGKIKIVEVYLEFPKKEIYLGKNFEFYLEIREMVKKGERFALACYPRILVKTQDTF